MHDPDDVVEMQAEELQSAADTLSERRSHIVGAYGHGLLDGDQASSHEHQQMRAYLAGYADALGYARGEVESITNCVRYLQRQNAETEADTDA